MSLPRGSIRTGLFALLLSIIVLSLLGSLLVADRALAIADRAAARLDARGLALIAERELRLRVAGLGELFGPLLATSQGSATDSALVARFASVWITDPAGRIVWRSRLFSRPGDSATVARLAAVPRSSPVVHVAPPSPGQARQVLLVVPLAHREARLGTAIALMSGDRFLASLIDTTVDRSELVLMSGGQPVFARVRELAAQGQIRADAAIDFPGDPLSIRVARPASGRSLRTALWMVAVAAVIALFGFLWRERRQGIQLAGRTAELERLYQEVARSNRMKSEFLANVSHELRTPLNAVVGFVEMLREGVYGELTPRQALPVDRIAASATHLRHLVDRLLDIAKIAAGRQVGWRCIPSRSSCGHSFSMWRARWSRSSASVD